MPAATKPAGAAGAKPATSQAQEGGGLLGGLTGGLTSGIGNLTSGAGAVTGKLGDVAGAGTTNGRVGKAGAVAAGAMAPECPSDPTAAPSRHSGRPQPRRAASPRRQRRPTYLLGPRHWNRFHGQAPLEDAYATHVGPKQLLPQPLPS